MMRIRHASAAALAGAIVLGLACEESIGPDPDPDPDPVAVPDTLTLRIEANDPEAPAAGAVLLRIEGPDSVVLVPTFGLRAFSARPSPTVLRAAIAGADLQQPPRLRIVISDSAQASLYSVTLEQVATTANARVAPSGYTPFLTP